MSEALAPAGIRICFCDLKGHAFTDWDAHEGFCLALDWAMANGHITPWEFMRRLDGALDELGITHEEIEREEPADLAVDTARAFGVEPLMRAWCSRSLVPCSAPLQSCVRSEYGFMVHVKGACQCPGRRSR